MDVTEWISLWQDWLTRDIAVYVAEFEGEVVGFAGGGPIREPKQTYDSELYTLYLLREVQARGIGKALLHAVASKLSQKGHKAMLTRVLEQNPAVRFYEKLGAQHLTTQQIDIGGLQLSELALGWKELEKLI